MDIPSAAGTFDIRTAKTLQASRQAAAWIAQQNARPNLQMQGPHTRRILYKGNSLLNSSDPCAVACLERYYRPDLPGSAEQPGIDPSAGNFPMSLASAYIVAIVLGTIHTLPCFLYVAFGMYAIGLFEIIVIECFTYGLFVMFLPASNSLCRSFGNRWIGLLGMILFVFGLILDSMSLHLVSLYVSHVLLLGLGGSLAYAAAVPVCCRCFRKNVEIALIITSGASCIGTILFFLLIGLLTYHLSYLWAKLILALIALLGAVATLVLPGKQASPETQSQQKSKDPTYPIIKQCIRQHMPPQRKRPGSRQYLCICMCDVSAWTDYSFLLWSLISMLAFMTVYVPYIFLAVDAILRGRSLIFIVFCLSSLLCRILLIYTTFPNFSFYRNIFCFACIISGICYIVTIYVDTYGWFLAWVIVMGCVEGVLSYAIPNVTSKTCPPNSIASYWTWIVVFHGIAVFTGPVFVLVSFLYNQHYFYCYIIIGMMQIAAALLSFLLPNEEELELAAAAALAAEGGGIYPLGLGRPLGSFAGYQCQGC